MDASDNLNEKQQLEQLYARSSDGELQEWAEGAESLTDEAKELLTSELARRGMAIPKAQPKIFAEPELQKLVMVRRFRDLPDALVAKGVLDSAGIESFLGNDNVVRMDWYWSNILGGIKLMVRGEDEEAATAVLNAPIPSEFDVEGAGHYEQPRCPKCGSEAISLKDLQRAVGLTGLFFSIPIPVHSQSWKCDSCGNEWRAEPEESQTSDIP